MHCQCQLSSATGVLAASYTPAQITAPVIDQQDRLCRKATAMFCAMLGTMAGNLALSLGAQGGVYIAEDIVPKLGSRFAENAFRERFEAKGRMRPYLASIPTYVITLPAAGLSRLRRRTGEAGALERFRIRLDRRRNSRREVKSQAAASASSTAPSMARLLAPQLRPGDAVLIGDYN